MGGNSSKEEKFFKTKKGIKVKKMDEPNPSEPPVDVIEDEPEYFETSGQREQSQNKANEESSAKNSARYPTDSRSFQNTQIEELKMTKPEEPKTNNLNIQRSINQNFIPSSQIAYENQNNLNSQINQIRYLNNKTNPENIQYIQNYIDSDSNVQKVVMMPNRQTNSENIQYIRNSKDSSSIIQKVVMMPNRLPPLVNLQNSQTLSNPVAPIMPIQTRAQQIVLVSPRRY